MIAVLLWVACAGSPGNGEGDTEDPDPNGACGDVTTHDVVVRGIVEDAAGPVAGADARLVDRAWNPGDVLAEGVTGADGSFELDAVGVTSVEDCWGTALDYVLEASEGDRAGERDANSALYAAITDGTAAELGTIVIAP